MTTRKALEMEAVEKLLPEFGAKLLGLSEKEWEVLGLMAEGFGNKAIAGRLFVQLRTVEANINNIFSRLGLPSSPDKSGRVEAVLMYLDMQKKLEEADHGIISSSME